MPTYSKETALYDTGAIANGLNAAGNTADTYITAVDENGITVHPARSNWSTTGGRTNINSTGMTVYVGSDDVAFYGATARIGKSNSDRVTVDSTNGITIYKGNSKRLQTTANGVDVYGSDGSTSIASFGSSTRIGKPYVSGASNNESHMELDYHSLQMIDKEGNSYFHVSDLRGTNGIATITETFYGNGSETTYTVNLPVVSEVSVTVNGTSASYTRNEKAYTLSTAPALGKAIQITYTSNSPLAKGFTIGTRNSSEDVGPYSVAEGNLCGAEGSYSHAEGLGSYAQGYCSHAEGRNGDAYGYCSHAQNYHTRAGDYQTAIGKYNANDPLHAFEVGNGTAEDARSNALTVGWDGTVTTARDINTTSVSGVFTNGSGITVSSFKFCQRGGVAAILIGAKKGTATAANTVITVGTIASGRRPPFECAGTTPFGTGDCYVNESGVVSFRSTAQVAANTVFYVRVTYPVA